MTTGSFAKQVGSAFAGRIHGWPRMAARALGGLALSADRAWLSAGCVLESIFSVKLSPYVSLQGLPCPPKSTPAVPQATIALMKVPLSLPPIVIVTGSVPSPRASSCGATPGYWAAAKSLVWAPPQ